MHHLETRILKSECITWKPEFLYLLLECQAEDIDFFSKFVSVNFEKAKQIMFNTIGQSSNILWKIHRQVSEWKLRNWPTRLLFQI